MSENLESSAVSVPNSSGGQLSAIRKAVLFENVSKNKKRLVVFLALFLILSIGLLVRLDFVKDWIHQPSRTMLESEPVLATFDGYYYLSLARDLVEDSYHPVDELRAVPDYPMRPSPPPLLSVVTALISTMTSYSLNWVAVLLPGLFAVLLAFPVYGLGKYYGGAATGLVAALLAITSPYLVQRTSIGRFDTDFMLVTWVCLAAWFFLRFAVTHTKSKYYYLIGGLTTWVLTVWWWDQAPHVATLLTLFPLFIAVAFYYRPRRNELPIFAMISAFMLTVMLWFFGADMFTSMFDRVLGLSNYISKQHYGDFPNIGATISEQKRPELWTAIISISGVPYIFLLSLVGLFLLAWKYRLKALFLAVPVGLSVMGYLFAERFLVFAAPVVGLGLGYLVGLLWKMQSRHGLFAGLALLLASTSSWSMYSVAKNLGAVFPVQPPALIKGIAQLEHETPVDSVVWAWWDHGYGINYWAQRTTVNDGQVHDGERSVYNALPYTTSKFRLSANFMQFYVMRGISGIHDLYDAAGSNAAGYSLMLNVLEKGPEHALGILRKTKLSPSDERSTPEDWLEFFYPVNPRSVSLFVDIRMAHVSSTWFALGSWNVERHEGVVQSSKPFYYVQKSKDRLFSETGLDINLDTGEITSLGNVKIKHLYIHDGKGSQVIDYGNNPGMIVEYQQSQGWAVVQNELISKSVFSQLQLRPHSVPKAYFEIIEDKSPVYQIWRVKADSLASKSKYSSKSQVIY